MKKYKLEIRKGYMIETKNGYVRQELLGTPEFDRYLDALAEYHKQKKLGRSVIFINRDDSIRIFKTI